MASTPASNDPPARSSRKRVSLNCLKCNRVFSSVDRVCNRICPRCNENNHGLSRVDQQGGYRSPVDVSAPGIGDLL